MGLTFLHGLFIAKKVFGAYYYKTCSYQHRWRKFIVSTTNDIIELSDSNNVVRIRLGIDSENRPYLSLNDSQGRDRLMLCVDKDGNGSLGFRTCEGHTIMSLGVSDQLGAGMMILDYRNDVRLSLEVSDGTGQIRMKSKQGYFTWPGGGAEK